MAVLKTHRTLDGPLVSLSSQIVLVVALIIWSPVLKLGSTAKLTS